MLDLYKILFPTGRAWYGQRNSDDAIYRAKAKCFNDINNNLNSVLSQILPDNESFDNDDIESWERVIAQNNSILSSEERKSIIYNRLSYPNGELYRQTAEFIENTLRNEGFYIRVYENRFWNGTNFESNTIGISNYGDIYGEILYGEISVTGEFVSNYLNTEIDKIYTPNFYGRENNVFFIGGETFGENAVIAPERLNEFKSLLMRLKPAHMAACLMLGGEWILENGTWNDNGYWIDTETWND